MLYYTCRGDVRGDCNVKHRSVGAALACCAKDNRDVKRGNGRNSYSDRAVVKVTDSGSEWVVADE